MAKTSERLLSHRHEDARFTDENMMLEVFSTGRNNANNIPRIRFELDEDTGVATFRELVSSDDEIEGWKSFVTVEFCQYILEHTKAQSIRDSEGKVIAEMVFDI